MGGYPPELAVMGTARHDAMGDTTNGGETNLSASARNCSLLLTTVIRDFFLFNFSIPPRHRKGGGSRHLTRTFQRNPLHARHARRPLRGSIGCSASWQGPPRPTSCHAEEARHGPFRFWPGARATLPALLVGSDPRRSSKQMNGR